MKGWKTFSLISRLKEDSPARCECTKQDPRLEALNGEWETIYNGRVLKIDVHADYVMYNSSKEDKFRIDRGYVFWATKEVGVWYLERRDSDGVDLVGLTWHFSGDRASPVETAS